jgi:lysophospholipase L1-like esterase
MNSNSTIRDQTSAYAAAMRNTLPEVIAETKDTLKNLEVHYLGDVLDNAIKSFLASGREGWELIEEADGFHPNQLGQAWFAESIWNATVSAGIIPPANPNNEVIREKFFNQENLRVEFI